ncbi:kinase-like domain-containing protein [Cercophora scortea]|uniref:Kinase-like domain-containing protein n=1 Tax=Cercophora scortea TaxID=314031 RepID=A0AAE0MMG6_9PEZI|nr:kinase-like domain-containing protein [Cercophora scortea]
MGRTCADCRRDLPRTSYTSNQYSKGEGLSRCAGCVHGHHVDVADSAPSDNGRYNASTRAEFTAESLSTPFASGAFRWVAKGRYTEGSRTGQACVCKWFKTGTVFEEDFFSLDIKAVAKALKIVNRFNQLNVFDKSIKINVPEVWTFDRSSGRWAGVKCLQEPFIQNYQKFNSNTGWTDTTRRWAQIMQALSHFSYHVSGGNDVLCDLQGGIYRDEVVLSDPVILSRTREYGVTDLGPEGISSFFSQHDCTGYCRPGWTRPAKPVQYFEPRMSTSMLRHTASVALSRPRHTVIIPAVFEEEEDY